MAHQPKYNLNDPYQRIAELETKLNRANRYIKRLRQENREFKRKFSRLQDKDKEPPMLLIREVSPLPLPTPPFPTPKPRRRRKRVTQYQQPERTITTRRRRRTWTQIPQVRLAALAIAAATVLMITTSAVSSVVRLVTRRPDQVESAQAQPAVVLTDIVDSPLIPPEYPSAQNVSLATAASTQVIPDDYSPAYNVTTAPALKPSQDLQLIVDQLVSMASEKGRPTQDLSITLINVKTNEVAGYQQQELRYPASVLKLFWMVYLYSEIAQGIFPGEEPFSLDLYKMIQQSANDAASRIIDIATGTKSGKELEGEEYQKWFKRRLQLSEFFQKAGYEGLIVSQKTYSTLPEPKGREGQMWNDPQQPIRNKISSEHAARLMYEIVTGKAVSPEYSKKMVQWLARDLRPEALADRPQNSFNPIEGFFGQSLPPDIDFASKAGWSSTGRHEVAFVKTRDGKTAYILSILASDRNYANDWDLFPKMSRHVFERLSGRS